MSPRVLGGQIVRVIRGNKRGTKFLGDRQEAFSNAFLVFGAVVLDLEVKVLAEDFFHFTSVFLRRVHVTELQIVKHASVESARKGDESLLALSQQILVDPRLIVEPLRERLRGEVDEILITGVILRQEYKVVVRAIRSLGDISRQSRAAG